MGLKDKFRTPDDIKQDIDNNLTALKADFEEVFKITETVDPEWTAKQREFVAGVKSASEFDGPVRHTYADKIVDTCIDNWYGILSYEQMIKIAENAGLHNSVDKKIYNEKVLREELAAVEGISTQENSSKTFEDLVSVYNGNPTPEALSEIENFAFEHQEDVLHYRSGDGTVDAYYAQGNVYRKTAEDEGFTTYNLKLRTGQWNYLADLNEPPEARFALKAIEDTEKTKQQNKQAPVL